MKKQLPVLLLMFFALLTRTAVFAQAPTTAASNIVEVGKSTSYISINWTSGNGSYRIVTCALATATTYSPVNGSSYTANSTFGSGSTTGSGNYVVYSGTSYGCTVFGL